MRVAALSNKKDRLLHCSSAVFKVIFDIIPFMLASSNCVCIQRRGYRIEYRILRVEIWNNSDFMGLRILAEMD